MIERNVGGRDRQARAVLAAAVAVAATLRNRQPVALVAGLTAVGLGVNAVTCFCALNHLLGVDTTDD